MALLGQASDEELLAVKIVLKARHKTAPGDVRIRTFPTDILADAVDHQHIDMVELHARQSSLRDLEHLVIPFKDLVVPKCTYLGDVIIRILYDRDAHHDRHFRQEFLGNQRDSLAKCIEPLLMEPGASIVLRQADRHHFAQSRLHIALEIRVRLYFVVKNNAIRFRRIFVTVDRGVHIIRDLADLDDLHAGSDRNAHGLFRDAIPVDDLQVARNGAAAMAAHSRNDKRPGVPFFQRIADRPYHQSIIRDPTAADGDRDRLSPDPVTVDPDPLHLVCQMCCDILDLIALIMLPDPVHFRHRHVFNPLHRE